MGTVERVNGIWVLWDRFSTRLGFEPPEVLGDIVIHPRDGEKVNIQAPDGKILNLRTNDVLHVRGEHGFARFTIGDLPPGYTIL